MHGLNLLIPLTKWPPSAVDKCMLNIETNKGTCIQVVSCDYARLFSCHNILSI